MSLMSESRETTLNASAFAAVAEHEARLLPLAEVLAHRRHHHDQRRERVGLASAPRPRAERSSSPRVAVERLGGRRAGAARRAAPRRTRPCRRRRGRPACLRRARRERAPERALGDVVEVARLASATVPSGASRSNGTALAGILGRARAGVEDDVVLGERGRAGDDRPPCARRAGFPSSSRLRARRGRGARTGRARATV